MGEKNDLHKVHISMDDLLEKGLSITGDSTTFYGTHLKDEFLSEGNIICNQYKNIIEIDEGESA